MFINQVITGKPHPVEMYTFYWGFIFDRGLESWLDCGESQNGPTFQVSEL